MELIYNTSYVLLNTTDLLILWENHGTPIVHKLMSISDYQVMVLLNLILIYFLIRITNVKHRCLTLWSYVDDVYTDLKTIRKRSLSNKAMIKSFAVNLGHLIQNLEDIEKHIDNYMIDEIGKNRNDIQLLGQKLSNNLKTIQSNFSVLDSRLLDFTAQEFRDFVSENRTKA